MAKSDKTGTVGRTSDPVKKPHSVEDIVPSSVPLIIPYLEIYRTNELEYVEYISPYLSSESSDGSSTGDDTEGSDSSQQSQEKLKSLKEKIRKLLDSYYPKMKNKDHYVDELASDELLWQSVAKTVNKMGNPKNSKQDYIIEQVMRLKEQYSGVSRQTYKNSKKQMKLIGALGNTKKGQKIITGLSNSKIYVGNGKYVNDKGLNQLGKVLQTISKKEK